MGLGLPDGGHLTHGYYTAKKKITASSIYFQSFPYRVDPTTGIIDYPQLETNANLFKPRLLVCGGSAYPRDWDYARLRKIADAQGSYLMSDMAHISGLVAAGEQSSPFDYCDVVTSTTHKTLRGPRAGIIFFRKDKDDHLEARVNQAVFPACQGGPHNNVRTALSLCLSLADDWFVDHCWCCCRSQASCRPRFQAVLEAGPSQCRRHGSSPLQARLQAADRRYREPPYPLGSPTYRFDRIKSREDL